MFYWSNLCHLRHGPDGVAFVPCSLSVTLSDRVQETNGIRLRLIIFVIDFIGLNNFVSLDTRFP